MLVSSTPGSAIDAQGTDIAGVMDALGRNAVAAAAALALADTATKNRALIAIAAALRGSVGQALAANARYMDAARAKGLSAAMLDRLALDEKRVAAMAR